MATAVLPPRAQQTTQINWGLPPKENEETTLDDYRAMIKQAECGEGMSFEQYTKKTHELQLIERGFADFQQGRVISHTQARKRYEKWL